MPSLPAIAESRTFTDKGLSLRSTGASYPADTMSGEPSSPPPEFSRFYQATIGPLRRYLRRLTNNDADAQDLAHDAYTRVLPAMREQRVQNPEAFLYTTARHLAANQLKRRDISPIAPAPAPETAASTAPGVVQQVIARQDLARLQAAIAELPPGCRQVLVLRKLDLLSHQEIADRLGIAVSTVEKQHLRALRLLRAALGPDTPATPRP
jgi:RNA polymerase sigma-70 factor (ECF subfamily)